MDGNMYEYMDGLINESNDGYDKWLKCVLSR